MTNTTNNPALQIEALIDDCGALLQDIEQILEKKRTSDPEWGTVGDVTAIRDLLMRISIQDRLTPDAYERDVMYQVAGELGLLTF